MPHHHFGPGLFAFFAELRENNAKPWFEANKARYERDVKEPLLRFIADFAPHLAAISPHFVADARPTGGSMFRIHRDVRFSKDKSPYKTWAAAHFHHEAHKDAHAPGFYLGLEPGKATAGSGIWQPDPPTLAGIRDAIVAEPDAWRSASGGFTLEGESLKRPPTGYDPTHPLIDDLKRKDFIAMIPFTEADACHPDFLDRYVAACRAMSPLVAFLTRATGNAW